MQTADVYMCPGDTQLVYSVSNKFTKAYVVYNLVGHLLDQIMSMNIMIKM